MFEGNVFTHFVLYSSYVFRFLILVNFPHWNFLCSRLVIDNVCVGGPLKRSALVPLVL